jgi:hypothetical protein
MRTVCTSRVHQTTGLSEMELSIFRQRSTEAIKQKPGAANSSGPSYLKTDDERIEKDADRRVQDAIALVSLVSTVGFAIFARMQGGGGACTLVYSIVSKRR